jgi:hypothetical protein
MHKGGRRGRSHILVGFTTTYAISAYHHFDEHPKHYTSEAVSL